MGEVRLIVDLVVADGSETAFLESIALITGWKGDGSAQDAANKAAAEIIRRCFADSQGSAAVDAALNKVAVTA